MSGRQMRILTVLCILAALASLVLLAVAGPVPAMLVALAAALSGSAGLHRAGSREARREAFFRQIDYERFISRPIADDRPLEALRQVVLARGEAFEREHSQILLDKQAQISALQSQINPHLLYNTLESIRGQALSEGSREIAAMAEALGAFFRYNISQKGLVVTLREELANVRNYVVIQKYRFDDQFDFELIEDGGEEAMGCYIPKLTIQPIIENAMYHGLEPKGEKGRVTVRVVATDYRLIITVSDDGTGMDAESLERLRGRIAHAHDVGVSGSAGQNDADSTGSLRGNAVDSLRSDAAAGEATRSGKGSGIALVNVDRRLKLIFGPEYGLQVFSTPGLGTDVEISMPILHVKPRLEVISHPQ